MSHVDKQMQDILQKITKVKENRDGKIKNPKQILAILSLREMELSDQLYFLRTPTSF